MGFPTALIYSSHDRCEYIHRQWIVERALQGNKKILFLPMSEATNEDSPDGRQDWAWGNFRWYFSQFEKWGLDAFPFYWNKHLTKDDVDQLMANLWAAEVVILGGGNPSTGLRHYKNLGAQFYGEPGCFGRILHERADRGLLTVGFSAGTDQLCEKMSSGIGRGHGDWQGFGLLRNVMATSHHEPGQEEHIGYGARSNPECMMFGLPNDSGIACQQGWTPGGSIWQLLHFITDHSWDIPNDSWHIKTRMGVGIPHVYADGRSWTFQGGDQMLRIQSTDCQFQQAWIMPANGGCYDYYSQQGTWMPGIYETIQQF